MEQELVTNRLMGMKGSHNGKTSDLYQHLAQILPELQNFQKDKIDPIKNLEYISEYIKKYQFQPSTPPTQQQLQLLLNLKIQYPQWLLLQEECIRKAAKVDPKDRLIQHFDQQHERLFCPIGIGFGKEESYLINCAIKILAEEKKAQKLRFWGKMLTQTKDYYVAQGFTKESNTDEPQGSTQRLKEGVNYHVYWVTQNLLSGPWIELPLVTPEQVQCSRYIKKILTGQIYRPVISSPPFGESEKYLLKAQIVRITHNCEISPRGLYAPLEDNPDEIDFAEEFKMPQFGELTNLENWVHVNPYILKLGRASYYVDPRLAEEQKEEYLAKLAENDPKIERLKAINQDKGLEKFGLEGCWAARIYGNVQVFNNVGKDEGTTSCYGVVALRNPHWPGWHTVASGKEFGSIYLGYGMKSSQAPFHPLGPADLCLQVEDTQECHEPNPRDPPDQLEPDSDDENKKAEE